MFDITEFAKIFRSINWHFSTINKKQYVLFFCLFIRVRGFLRRHYQMFWGNYCLRVYRFLRILILMITVYLLTNNLQHFSVTFPLVFSLYLIRLILRIKKISPDVVCVHMSVWILIDNNRYNSVYLEITSFKWFVIFTIRVILR